MSTNLENCTTLLSKQLGDYWASTTTGGGSSIHLVDSALKAKAVDWITDETYVIVREGTYDGIERKVSLLSDETLTVQAYADTVGSGIDYELHRLFTPSEKRRALVDAAKSCFPHLFTEVRDESKVSGNWLKDGSFEIWSSSSVLTHWSKSGSVSLNISTTSPYYKHGKTCCLMDTATGYLYQAITNNDDLKYLQGKTVTFTAQGHSNTASSLKLAIYDGTTETSSSFNDADTAWTEDGNPLSVTATIQDNPDAIEFRIYHAVATAADYVDDARVISGGNSPRIYISDLGLVQNKPHQVLIEPSNYSNQEPWPLIHGIAYDQTNGYMYLPDYVSNDYRLRILGTKYLDFYDDDGAVGTDWEDTIAIDSPQTEILVAQAAIYLCNQMVVPNDTSGTSETWIQALGYWQRELMVRKARFGMTAPSATISYGV